MNCFTRIFNIRAAAVAVMTLMILFGGVCELLASGNSPAAPPAVQPTDAEPAKLYFRQASDVRLYWNVPTDPENDTIEMKVVFSNGPMNVSPGPLSPTQNTNCVSSEVVAYKPMFSINTPVQTALAGTAVTFSVINGTFPFALTEGKWWWDVHAYDGTSYNNSIPPSAIRQPRYFILDFTKPTLTGLNFSNSVFSPASPDPLKRTTTLFYNLSETSAVTIEVLDSNGNPVRTLESGVSHNTPPTTQSCNWNANFPPDGKYTFRLRAVDLAGNISDEATRQVEILSTLPGVTITSAPAPNPFSPKVTTPAEFRTTSMTYQITDTADVEVRVTPNGSTVLTYQLQAKTKMYPGANPVTVTWNGKNSNGDIVADGSYTLTVISTNEIGFVNTAANNVVVDTTAPDVSPASAIPSPFSPSISPTVVTYSLSEDATVSVLIKDITRTTTIRTIQPASWLAQKIAPNNYTAQWDGRDSGGTNFVADGQYAFEITATDAAGNTSVTYGTINVDKSGPIIAPYSISPLAISRSGMPGTSANATISYTISKAGTVEIRIIAANGPQIRQLLPPTAQTQGSHTVLWDGTTDGVTPADEGNYKVEIYLTDTAGNPGSPNPAVLTVAVDSTPPQIAGLTATPNMISPGNSVGTYDTTTISYNLSESAEVNIQITNASGSLVRTLQTTITQTAGLKSIVWDGKDGSNPSAAVPSGVYTVTVTAKDTAKNESTATVNVTVDNESPQVSILSVQPVPFAPDSINAASRVVTVRYTIVDTTAQCTAEIQVKNILGGLIKTLGTNLTISTGSIQQVQWDGKNSLSQLVDDGTYSIVINATDAVGNPTANGAYSAEVYLLNHSPIITAAKFRDNRNTIDTDDTVEITFDMPIDDASVVGQAADTVFSLIGSGTFGAGARIETGNVQNDGIIEIVLGAGYTKVQENSDYIQILPNCDRVRSYPVQVVSKDNVAHIIGDGSPPYLNAPANYVDVGNDGLNRGDQIILNFNEPVSVARNSASALRLLPTGRGYSLGAGAFLSNGGSATQIVLTLGDVSTTSVMVRGLFDPTGVDPIPTGINIVAGQIAIVDNAGNFGTANMYMDPALPFPGVDIASTDIAGPKLVYAKYHDANQTVGNGGLSQGDKIFVGFDKAVLVTPDPNPNPSGVFRMPVQGDTFGAGAVFTYSGTKEVGVILGANPVMTVKGSYILGNDTAGSPSGFDIRASLTDITDLAGNPVMLGLPVDLGSIDTTAPKVLVAKLISNFGDNYINPTSGTFTITAICDDLTLKDGNVTVDLSSIGQSSKEVLTKLPGSNTFQKIVNFVPNPPYISGAKSFTINAEDFSGNIAQPYTFTAYVVEPASEVFGEINPSSVPKRQDVSAPPEDFTVTVLPKFQSYNRGIDTITIKHPGGGYSFTNETIDVYIGTSKIEPNANYSVTKVDPLITINLLGQSNKLTSATANPKITVKFRINVPQVANSPIGSTFEVAVSESSFAAPFQQSVQPGNVDDIADNNNKFRVVVSDVAIESVQTKLDYSDFFWRINFVVKFNKELSTLKNPECYYQPENVTPVISEIPVQYQRFENLRDTTAAGSPLKAYFTGYVRVPIDNANYLNTFTFYARNFYETEGVLIAKAYKKGNTMSAGFVTSAFTNPIDERDLIITIISTTPLTQQFQLGVRQPGKIPVYKQRNELISHRQNLFSYKFRIDENYSNQIDISIMNPGETFPATAPAYAKSSGAAPAGNNGFYSVKMASSDLSSDMALKSADGLFEMFKAAEPQGRSRLFLVARQPAISDSIPKNPSLFRVGGIYSVSAGDLKCMGRFAFNIKPDPDFSALPLAGGHDLSAVRGDNIGVYRLDGSSWKFVPGRRENDGSVTAEASELGTFALFADIEKPSIKIGGSSGRVIKNRIVMDVADSGSGVDLGTLKVVYNGRARSLGASSDASGSQVIVDASSLKAAGVDTGNASQISFEVADRAGNVSRSQAVAFQVAPGTGLLDSIRVYPNPAKTIANIQYLLSSAAEEVDLKIYDTAMNLVYTSDMNPTSAANAPHVIRWTLTSDDGDRVGNGVYYYKLTVVRNGEKIEKIGKIAVLR